MSLFPQVLDRKCCLETMSDVNEAGWYRMHLKPNTAAVIVLRLISSLRQESDCPLSLLTIQALQVLVFKALRTFAHVKNVAPTLILRRLLEVFCQMTAHKSKAKGVTTSKNPTLLFRYLDYLMLTSLLF
eukprot:sb/3475324/